MSTREMYLDRLTERADQAERRVGQLEAALHRIIQEPTWAPEIASKVLRATASVSTPQDSSAASSVITDGARGPAAADGPHSSSEQRSSEARCTFIDGNLQCTLLGSHVRAGYRDGHVLGPRQNEARVPYDLESVPVKEGGAPPGLDERVDLSRDIEPRTGHPRTKAPLYDQLVTVRRLASDDEYLSVDDRAALKVVLAMAEQRLPEPAAPETDDWTRAERWLVEYGLKDVAGTVAHYALERIIRSARESRTDYARPPQCSVCGDFPATMCSGCHEEAVDHFVDDKSRMHCLRCSHSGCPGIPRPETPLPDPRELVAVLRAMAEQATPGLADGYRESALVVELILAALNEGGGSDG